MQSPQRLIASTRPLTAFSLALGSAFAIAASAHATNVGGLILFDTTWTLSNSPYIVTSPITIGSDAKLTIQPGVVVKFNSGTGIDVGGGFGPGTLKAIGSPTQRITFTSNAPTGQPGQWTSIRFNDLATDAVLDVEGNYVSGSILDDCIVEFAGAVSSGAVQIQSSSPLVESIEVRSNQGTGLFANGSTGFTGGQLRVLNSSFHHNGEGLYIDFSQPVICEGNAVASNLFDGARVNFRNANVIIRDNGISQNGGNGLRVTPATGFQVPPEVLISSNAVIANGTAGVGLDTSFNGGGTFTVLNNTISGNGDQAKGGGLYCFSQAEAVVTVRGNTISSNKQQGAGGGVAMYDYNNKTTWIVEDNVISDNTALRGGGLYLHSNSSGGAAFKLTNNLIQGNSVQPSSPQIACGGGIYFENVDGGPVESSLTMTSNSIVGNVASGGTTGGVGFGGGLYVSESNSTNKTTVRLDGSPQARQHNVFNGNSADLGAAVFNGMLFSADGSNDIDAEYVCWGGLDPDHDTNPNLIYDHFDTEQKAFVDYSPYIADSDCGSPCGAGEILDCNGNCAPASWIGDDYCDDGSWVYKGNPIYLNCDPFDFDGGDCNPPRDPFIAPPNNDVPAVAAYDAAAIEVIAEDASTNLVIVTHGWNTTQEMFKAKWVHFAEEIQAGISASGAWTVKPWDWTDHCERWQVDVLRSPLENATDAILSASKAATNGWSQGLKLGKEIGAKDYEHIHLIAHSAGSALISAATTAIRDTVSARGGTQPTIHCTFLDAFVPFSFLFGGKSGTELYGESADFSEQYFYKSFLQDISGPSTSKTLTHCWNSDVTEATSYPACGLLFYLICGHSWPVDFYSMTVDGTISCTETSVAADVGFALSKEKLGAGWLAAVKGLTPGSQQALSASECLGQPGGVAGGGDAAEDSFVPWSRQDAPLTLTSLNSVKSAEAAVTIARESLTLTTAPSSDSAWVNLQFISTQPVNFVRLTVDFVRSGDAVGLLTAYFDGKSIGLADEAPYILDGSDVVYYLTETAAPGTHVISFRLDDQATGSSTVTIATLATGFGAFVPLGDLDGDGVVGQIDLAILLGAWGGTGTGDLDSDGSIGPADLAILLGAWST